MKATRKEIEMEPTFALRLQFQNDGATHHRDVELPKAEDDCTAIIQGRIAWEKSLCHNPSSGELIQKYPEKDEDRLISRFVKETS